MTNCYVSTSNALVDVIKAQVYIGSTSFVPDTYGGLIFQESDRVLKARERRGRPKRKPAMADEPFEIKFNSTDWATAASGWSGMGCRD